MNVIAIIEVIAKIVGFFISLPQQGAETAKKKYINWRLESGIRKKIRQSRADLLNSVDELQSKRELPKEP